MSDDEILLLIASTIVALASWTAWYVQAARVAAFGLPAEGRRMLRITPIVSLALLWAVLRTMASFDVREDGRYLLMYTMLGLAWLGVTVRFSAFAGVSMRDDVLERRNGAAAIALGGAILGVMLAFAGGNIGDGPGWWVVLFSALLSTTALFAAWILLDALVGVSDSVTVERDRASGLRLAGFLIAQGAVLGRAVAGDWVSASATLYDFVLVGWPSLVLVGVAILVEVVTKPTAERPVPPIGPAGLAPAVAYVLFAVASLTAAGQGVR